MLSTSWTHPTPGSANEFKFAALPQDLLEMSEELESLGGGDTSVLRVESVCRVCPVRPPVSDPAKFIPSQDIVSTDGAAVLVEDPRARDTASAHSSTRTYNLSTGLPCTATQADVYDVVGLPALEMLWDGFNSVIMAAGAVGTGKTYTLFSPKVQYTDEEGLLSRILRELFRRVEKSPSSGHYHVGLSCFEVCDKEIIDLLQMRRDQFPVRGSSPNPRFVNVRVTDKKIAERTLQTAWRQSVSWTDGIGPAPPSFLPNRGHTFVRVTLYDAVEKRISTLHVVDLAGSMALSALQRSTADTETAARQQERRMINQHLLSLSRVISELAMVEERGNRYSMGKPTTNAKATSARESKLTQLLGPLIAGNAKTFFIATVSPHPDNYMDTVNTLRIASRAMAIQTACMRTQNVDIEDLGFLPFEHVLTIGEVREQLNSTNRSAPPAKGQRKVRLDLNKNQSASERPSDSKGAPRGRSPGRVGDRPEWDASTHTGKDRRSRSSSPAKSPRKSTSRGGSKSPRRDDSRARKSRGGRSASPRGGQRSSSRSASRSRSPNPRGKSRADKTSVPTSPPRETETGHGSGLISPTSARRPAPKKSSRIKMLVDRLATQLADEVQEDLHDERTQRINLLAANDESVHALHRRATGMAREALETAPGGSRAAPYEDLTENGEEVNQTIDSIVDDLETSRLLRLEKILAMTPHPHEKKNTRSVSPSARSPVISQEMRAVAADLRRSASAQHDAIDAERTRTKQLRAEIMHVMNNLSPAAGDDGRSAVPSSWRDTHSHHHSPANTTGGGGGGLAFVQNADDSGTGSVRHISPETRLRSRSPSPIRASRSAPIPASPPRDSGRGRSQGASSRRQGSAPSSPVRKTQPRFESPPRRLVGSPKGTPQKSALSATRDLSNMEDVERLRENYETLLGVLRHEQDEKEALQAQVKTLEQSRSETRTLRDVELESLRIENVELRAKLRQLESESPDFQDLFAQYEEDVAKLAREAMDLRRENLRVVKEYMDYPSPPPEAHPLTGAAARSEVERREMVKLQKEVVSLRKENHQLMQGERQRLLATRTLEHSKRRFDNLTKELKDKQNALKATQHARLHLEAQLEETQAENTRLRNIDDALRGQVSEIMTETDVLHKAFRRFTRDHERQTMLQKTRRQQQGATGLAARGRGAGGSQRPSEVLTVLRKHVEGRDVKSATLCNKLGKLMQAQEKDYTAMVARENELLDLLTEDHRKVAAIETALFERIESINRSVQELRS